MSVIQALIIMTLSLGRCDAVSTGKDCRDSETIAASIFRIETDSCSQLNF